MMLLITLIVTSVAGYLKLTLTEEIEAVEAGLVTLGAFLSLLFAPILLKLALLAVLLLFPKATVV